MNLLFYNIATAFFYAKGNYFHIAKLSANVKRQHIRVEDIERFLERPRGKVNSVSKERYFFFVEK